MDINGDGLVDRVKKNVSGDLEVWFNTGAGFKHFGTITAAGDMQPLRVNSENESQTEVDYIDLNGDGYPDRVEKNSSSNTVTIRENRIYGGPGACAGKLYKVLKPSGGSMVYKYRPLNKTENMNCRPNLWVVDEVITHDGFTPFSTFSRYTYKNGYFHEDTTDREFRGFGEVIKEDLKQLLWQVRRTSTTVSKYYTDEIIYINFIGTPHKGLFKGLLKSVEIYHPSVDPGDIHGLINKEEIEYEAFRFINDITVINQTKVKSIIKDGQGNTRPMYTLVEYEHAYSNGLLSSIRSINYGEVDSNWQDIPNRYTSEPDKSDTIVYFNNHTESEKWLLKQKSMEIINGYVYDGREWKQESCTVYAYNDDDNLKTIGKVIISESGSSYVIPQAYFEYDDYGNVVISKDANENTTRYVYDITFKSHLEETHTCTSDGLIFRFY
jgi:hypothetical protein